MGKPAEAVSKHCIKGTLLRTAPPPGGAESPNQLSVTPKLAG